MWRRYSGYDSREIWKYIWNLQVVEKYIDRIPQVEYKDGDADLLNFDHYGIDFDMYCVGTWTILQSFKSKLEHIELPEIVSTVMEKSREQIGSEIPKPLPRPENWNYDLSIPLEALEKLWAKKEA